MNKLPSFPFYVQDFLNGTAQMKNEEAGAYIRLLCHQWDKGSLPNNKDELIKLCFGDSAGIDAAIDKFYVKKNKLLNKKLETVLRKIKNFSKKNKKNGEKGAKIRWRERNSGAGLNGQAIKSPLAKNSFSSSSSFSSSKLHASMQQVFELLRSAAGNEISDAQIELETKAFIERYHEEKISNLKKLCTTWANNINREEKKQMVD